MEKSNPKTAMVMILIHHKVKFTFMEQNDLQELLQSLLSESHEQAWLEFKTNVAVQKASVTSEGIGEYISALSNGACISNKDFGYLVLGIKDVTHAVVGTNFNPRTYKIGNQDFELWLRTLLYPKVSFEINRDPNRGSTTFVKRTLITQLIPPPKNGIALSCGVAHCRPVASLWHFASPHHEEITYETRMGQ